MAGASYASTRSDINKFPIPAGWEVVPNSHVQDASTGFEVTAFQKGTEIVISFAGTDPKDITGDIAADMVNGVGVVFQ